MYFSEKSCLNNCNGHGKCDTAEGWCICDEYFYGDSCACKL